MSTAPATAPCVFLSYARADQGRAQVLAEALERAGVLLWLDRTSIVCDAANVRWTLGRKDHVALIERNLRLKVVAPDFRYPMMDGRLSLAQLCARVVLDEQGARPLRAIVDHDQALALIRSGSPERVRIAALLNAALAQFRWIGMTGWIARADALKAGAMR